MSTSQRDSAAPVKVLDGLQTQNKPDSLQQLNKSSYDTEKQLQEKNTWQIYLKN